MSTCTKEKLIVKTEEGTYILPTDDEAPGRCAAEKKCTELGGILAPFTEKSEFDAVMDAIKSCSYQNNNWDLKFVGLKITADNSTRVFTNGIEFDYGLHGDLYQENELWLPENCPGAFLSLGFPEKLQITDDWKCLDIPTKYICFKPKKLAKSEGITGAVVYNNSNSFIFGGLLQIASICLIVFLVIKIKKLKSDVSKQNPSLA